MSCDYASHIIWQFQLYGQVINASTILSFLDLKSAFYSTVRRLCNKYVAVDNDHSIVGPDAMAEMLASFGFGADDIQLVL